MKFLKDRILPLCMIALLGGLLPACVNDEGDTNAISDDGSLFISIAISTGDTPTARVDKSEGTIAENFIDKDDLKIYAFSVPANETEMNDLSESKLLKVIYSGTEADNKSVLTSVGGKYYLRTELDPDIFSEHKKFRLVAVANLKTFNPTLTFTAQTLNDFQKHAFTISTPNNISWIPDSEKKQGIPMFGLKEVDLSDYDKKVYNEANPYGLGTMNMLRTLAKIEIVNGAGTELDITKVTISPYKIKGYLTPDLLGEQLKDTKNVDSARIPDEGDELDPLGFSSQDDGNVFVAYLPEYAFDSDATRELITVYIGDASYKLSLSPYDANGPVTDKETLAAYPWNAILRNHIYRYTITKIAEPALEVSYIIEYTVCPMDKATSADIEFN